MNHTTEYKSPALRIEAVSINCIALEVYCYAVSCNLLIRAESLTAEQYYALLYLRLIILIHMMCRNAQETNTFDQRINITQIADTIVDTSTGSVSAITQPFTYAYGDANHKHAVTVVTSPSTLVIRKKNKIYIRV